MARPVCRPGEYPPRCDNVAMRSDGRGRPRLEQSRRPGKTAREEILDAAAELFTNLGLRQHLDAADRRRGRRSSSLAVSPLRHQGRHPRRAAGRHRRRAVAVGRRATRRRRSGRAAAARTGGRRRHPAVRQPVEPRRALPAARATAGPIRAVPAAPRGTARPLPQPRRPGRSPSATGRPTPTTCRFGLVESVINRRSDDADCPDEQPWVIADGALRTLGFEGDFAAFAAHSPGYDDSPV